MPARSELLRRVADAILALPAPGTLRVGIDGVDGSGKTTFADELADLLAGSARPVIRASVDGFHNPRAVRYRLGRTSPEGFYHDSYNHLLLRTFLLDPLSPGGSGRYRIAAFDHRSDAPVIPAEEEVLPGAILLFDGIFLHRPELRHYWDYSIFLRVRFQVSIRRCAARDNGSPDPDAPENRRYVEGQKLYLRACNPEREATVVINNDDFGAPFFVD